jgi:hypothetical protein
LEDDVGDEGDGEDGGGGSVQLYMDHDFEGMRAIYENPIDPRSTEDGRELSEEISYSVRGDRGENREKRGEKGEKGEDEERREVSVYFFFFFFLDDII